MKKINEYEITEMKSKFISILYEIDNENDAKFILNELKEMHPKARHMPYAYILGNTAKKTDDKEPHNTAGIQIYNQLINNNLHNHLLVIIRYYGGKKLGVGNLLRTYLKSAKSVIEHI